MLYNMADVLNWWIAIVFLIVGLICASLRRKQKGTKIPLPPGPRRLPIIGNVLDVPSTHEWLAAAKWREQYGDVVYLELFGLPVVFLNSYEAAVDILEKRSAIYSTRPSFTMANELQKWDWTLALMPYGDYWRRHREMLRSFLDPPGIMQALEIENREILKMLISFSKSPGRFIKHARTAVGGIILSLSYGYEVESENDKLISILEEATAVFSQAIPPGSFLVNALPQLKHVPEWFPGANFQKIARKGRYYSSTMLNGPYEAAKREALAGTAPYCLTGELIRKNVNDKGQIVDEDFIVRCAANAYGAGSDTTTTSILCFIIAMLQNPAVQKRGQEEVDRVVGLDRLPTFEDKAELPYVEAICLEVLRWANITPSGGPHASTADDVHNGYFIPKGSMIVPNQWLMQTDPTVYHNPESFIPERHIASDKKPAERSPLKTVFGFGRRICPGRHLAMQTIFIAVSNILCVFDISKARGPDGQVIEPELVMKPGSIRQPEPFQCNITPRSQSKVEVLGQTWTNLNDH